MGNIFTRREFVRGISAAIAAATAGCKEPSNISVEHYQGNLEGYGSTRLEVYKWKNMGRIFGIRATSEMKGDSREIYELNTPNVIGRFQGGRIYGGNRTFSVVTPDEKEFTEIENFVIDVYWKRDKLRKTD